MGNSFDVYYNNDYKMSHSARAAVVCYTPVKPSHATQRSQPLIHGATLTPGIRAALMLMVTNEVATWLCPLAWWKRGPDQLETGRVARPVHARIAKVKVLPGIDTDT
eukprot:COSAG06_NODE_2543_length_6702_cov_2.532031_4_plen_107_part_00